MTTQKHLEYRNSKAKSQFEPVNWSAYRAKYEIRISEKDSNGKIQQKVFLGDQNISKDSWLDLSKSEDRHLLREVQQIVRTHAFFERLRDDDRSYYVMIQVTLAVFPIAIYLKSLGITPNNEAFQRMVFAKGIEQIELKEQARIGVDNIVEMLGTEEAARVTRVLRAITEHIKKAQN